MGQGDKTTTGGPSESPRRQSTQPGLKVENKKIVTKRGLVAPCPEDPTRLNEFIPESDRSSGQLGQPSASGLPKTTARLGSVSPRKSASETQQAGSPAEVSSMLDISGGGSSPHHDQVTHEDSDLTGEKASRDATRELATDPQAAESPFLEGTGEAGSTRWAPEDFTPREGSDLDEEIERSRFRTAPGGGKNRISGGRLQAKAYVSPVTVKPSTGNTPITAAVKVHDIVESAVRAYQTEPSLLRRRQSSLPPKPDAARERLYVWVGGAAAILVLGSVIFWVTLRGAEQATPTSPAEPIPAVNEEGPPASVRKEQPSNAASRAATEPLGQTQNDAERAPAADTTAGTESRSTSESGKGVVAAPAQKAPAPVSAPAKKSAPPSSSSAAPAPSPAPTAAPQKSNDLWLE